MPIKEVETALGDVPRAVSHYLKVSSFPEVVCPDYSALSKKTFIV